jgi:DNA-binding transcriptional MerR regulator
MLTIGRLAKRARVGIETVRFYEREGVLAAPPRTESGYRQYPEAAVTRPRFVRRAQQLGFTLAEIKDLLALWEDPSAGRADVRARAEAKIAVVRAKIRDLEGVLTRLVHLRDACDGAGPAAGCPILSALDGSSDADLEPSGHGQPN